MRRDIITGAELIQENMDAYDRRESRREQQRLDSFQHLLGRAPRDQDEWDPRETQTHDHVTVTPIVGHVWCAVCEKYDGSLEAAEVGLGKDNWMNVCMNCLDALAYQLRQNGLGRLQPGKQRTWRD